MRGITVLKVLAVVLLVIGPAPVSAVPWARDEKTTITLIGEDAQGRFTNFLQQTQIGTNDFALIMDLAISSNYEYDACLRNVDPFNYFNDVQFLCARDLWVAVQMPNSELIFLELGPGLSIGVYHAGFLITFPFIDFMRPYFVLGAVFPPPLPGLDIKPYPSRGHLFGITQAFVNSLQPGSYSIFAGYTTTVGNNNHANNIIEDIFNNAVSNIAQYDVVIEEAKVPCDEAQVAGADADDYRVIDLKNIGGTFRFDYQTFQRKDRMFVRYEGNLIFDTQCVGTDTTQSVFLEYHGSSTKVSVQVQPNCAGGSQTQWNYTVHCPVSSFP